MAGRREPPRPGGRQRRTIVASVELTALARHLTSRRFMAQVITGAIVLAALAELMRENQARNVARLVAWDRKRSLRDQVAARPGRERAHDAWLQASDRRTPTCADTAILIRNG